MSETKHPPQQYKDHIGLIHLQAKFGFKWACQSGLIMAYDDLYQEACIAFLKAAEGYDPDTGLKFSTYFTKVAFSQFRQTIGVMTGVKNLNPRQRTEIIDRKAENKRRAKAGLPQLKDISYGLRPMQFSEVEGSGEDFSSFEDGLPSDCRTPEQLLEFKQEYEKATANLSPLAALIVEWLRDPPQELLTELNKKLAFSEQGQDGRAESRKYGLRDGLTVTNVARFLSLVDGNSITVEQLVMAKGELNQIVKQLEAS